MKKLQNALALTSALFVTSQAVAETALKVGSEVNLQAVSEAHWVQGEPLTEWEPGKIYMFECWATWCGPCIAAIPHVNALHEKYYDKGLRIYGVNVWEDGLDKVEKFVEGRGEGMAYPVVYTGQDSVFEKDWLKAAGVRGIPHAFIVKDGKLLFTTHPAKLQDEVIETLLSGDEGIAKIQEGFSTEKNARDQVTNLMAEFRAATAAGDVETMKEKMGEFEKLQPNSPHLRGMKLDLLIAQKDWEAAGEAIAELEGPGSHMSLAMVASKIATEEGDVFPAEFAKVATEAYGKTLHTSGGQVSPFEFVLLSVLQTKIGDKEAAVKTATEMLERARSSDRGFPVKPFERFLKGTEEDEAPTLKEFSGWMQEALKENAGAVPAARIMPSPAK